MLSLPRKRPVDIEDNGTSDEEEWHVGYAEDIDEQRAELLRRLDSKAAGPTKLVNPWATPSGPSRGAVPDGDLVLDVDVNADHQIRDGDAGRGLSRADDSSGGGRASISGDAGKSGCVGGYDEAMASPLGLGNMLGRQQYQWTPELLQRGVQYQQHHHEQPSSAAGTAAAAALAATQVEQLFEDLMCAAGGGGDHGGGGARNSASQNGWTTTATTTPVALAGGRRGNGPSNGPTIGHVGGGGGRGGSTLASANAGPYAALLGPPGGGGMGGRGPAAMVRNPPSPLALLLGPNSSSSSRSAPRPSRLGLGSLVPLPPTGSSQKGKKAKFVIRESPNVSAVPATGHRPQPQQPLPHYHHHHHHQQQQQQLPDMPGGMSLRNMASEATAGGNLGGGGDVVMAETEETRPAGPASMINRSHDSTSTGGLAALLGYGPPPPPPAAAAAVTKHSIGSTPIGRCHLPRAVVPSPVTAPLKIRGASSRGGQAVGDPSGSARPAPLTPGPVTAAAAARTGRARPDSIPQGTPAAAMLAATATSAAEHAVTPAKCLLKPGPIETAVTTPLQTTMRMSSAPPSLRGLLQPQLPLPPPAPSGSAIRGFAAAMGAPGAAGCEEGCLRHPETVTSGGPRSAHLSQGHGQGQGQGEADSSIHRFHQHQQQQRQPDKEGRLQLPQPLQQEQDLRHQERDDQQQEQEGKHGQDRSDPLELMGHQLHRQKEFLQGLGRPTPPSALALGRRSSAGGGRGGVANATGLQGRLQAVLANLKAAFDREAEIAMSCKPQSPPPGSLLVEVCSRTREAHLTKAVCRILQLYGEAAEDGSSGGVGCAAGAGPQALMSAPDAAVNKAAQPLLVQPLVGQQVHVFLDSKRGDWGIEPGSNLLVLMPYKVLRVPISGAQAPVTGPETGARTLAPGLGGGPGGLEGGVGGGAVGGAQLREGGAGGLGLSKSSGSDNRTAAMETSCGDGGREPGGTAVSGLGESTEELVVLAHVTRRYGSAVS